MTRRLHRIAAAAVAGLLALPASGQWTDISDAILHDTAADTKKVVWGDFDGDGWQDLLWLNSGIDDGRLLRNLGDGTFLDVTPLPLLGDANNGTATAGDVDGDGDLDVVVCAWSGASNVLRNDGGFVFTEIELWPSSLRARGAALADYDGDGILDLYASTQGNYAPLGEDKLFRGLGAVAFADVTPAILEGEDKGRGVVWADFDDDGDVDLYVANGNGCPCEWETMPLDWIPAARNRMYRNDGGVLVDVTDAVTGDLGNGRGVAAGDYDNDGDLDLFVANLAIEGGIEGPKNVGPFGGQNRILRNDGDFVFTDVTPANLIDDTTQERSCAWIDVDNDGDLDLHTMSVLYQKSRLWINQGGGVFTDATTPELYVGSSGRAASWADLDRDGDMDVYVTFKSGWNNKLLRNDLADATGNHWLVVALEGTVSNRSAVGARVIAEAGDLLVVREVVTGTGYWAQHMLPQHLGLGAHATIDRLRVRWPSGLVTVRSDVPGDQELAIVEPTGCRDLVDAADCDGNGRRDECDIADGLAEDCNGNGIPDACDLAAGTSLDEDRDGVPDECVAAPPCPADADGDGMVGFGDVVAVLGWWGFDCHGCPGDLDGDQQVGLSDLIVVLAAWGPCP